MTLNNLRRFLYRLARYLGDLNAIGKGKFSQRRIRRSAWKNTGRGLGKFFR